MGQILRALGVIPVIMGQDQAVDAADALAQQVLGGDIRSLFTPVAAAVHQEGISLALQHDALSLPHIQHRHPVIAGQRLEEAQHQTDTKRRRREPEGHTRALVPGD